MRLTDVMDIWGNVAIIHSVTCIVVVQQHSVSLPWSSSLWGLLDSEFTGGGQGRDMGWTKLMNQEGTDGASRHCKSLAVSI